MQTILGAGGAIGIELAKALRQYTTAIRLVSRNPEKVNDTDELLATDLTVTKNVDAAVEGSSIVYITIGFPYSYKVWQKLWPKFIADIIAACKKHRSKLVFFDNIYMYDADGLNPATENASINPPSKKGKVRAQIAQKIMHEIEEGELTALIARSADFYGPGIKETSILTETVFKPLSEDKKATWLGNDGYQHSFTFTKDAGEATAILGNTDDAYGEVWHLPTAKNPPTGKQWVEMIAEKMGKHPNYRVAPKFVIWLIGIFVPIMRETHEMLYQYDRDYVFDSTKFEQRFDYQPTPYAKGVEEVIRADYL